MPKAPKPKDEEARIRDLYKYHVLDTNPEELFDDITILAADLLDTPIALISFVDHERQWFKSSIGLDVAETSRDASFCAYAVYEKSAFVVEDAQADRRVCDNPLVTGDPHIRAYAGAPLLSDKGQVLGTLCVIAKEPRSFSEREMEHLHRLAKQVISLLEARLMNQQLLEEKINVENANRAKGDFLSMMSHELRTPLNSIIGFTKLLRMKLASQLSERDLDALDTVARNGNLLLELINDILDLSKIEAGKVNLSPTTFKVKPVIEGVLATVQPMAEEKSLSLEVVCSDEVSLLADRTRMTQAISNLLSNAVKYTDTGSIVVRVLSEEDMISIAIEDTGQGIPEQQLQYLFQRFTQLSKDEAKRRGGTGLGLLITRELVELHGGTISVDSRPGEGSTFTIHVPRQFNSFVNQELVSDLVVSNVDLSGINILCVDDDPDSLKYLHQLLREEGYNTMLAGSYEEVFSLLDKQIPDVLLLDLVLPGKDGYQILDELHQDSRYRDIPVIVVSAIADVMAPVRHAPLSVLQKPVDKEDLASQIQLAIGRKIKSLLLVEDDESIAALLMQQLAAYELRVKHVASGREALTCLQGDESYGAIILDLMMPEMDGFALLKSIEQEGRFADIPVIVLTSRTLSEEEYTLLQRSTRAILSKGKGNTKKLLQILLREAHRE